MAPSSSDQNGAVCTATTLPLNSGNDAGAAIEGAIAAQVEIRARQSHVILVSDYQKGVITRRSMAHVLGFAQSAGLPVIVDGACIGAIGVGSGSGDQDRKSVV